MKKIHFKSLKLHTIFSLIIAVLFTVAFFIAQDAILWIALVTLAVYILGNAIIHAKHNELRRDTMIEYSVIAVAVLIIVVAAIY
ncbi:MAG: hypothetical protein JWN33_494 [Candidatus Saccharibacteria bacterium]|nr:hypothetical protein [Candidatus Saccharibacteria bacterium]